MYKLIKREVCYPNGEDIITFEENCRVDGEDEMAELTINNKGVLDLADYNWYISELKTIVRDAQKIMKKFN